MDDLSRKPIIQNYKHDIGGILSSAGVLVLLLHLFSRKKDRERVASLETSNHRLFSFMEGGGIFRGRAKAEE